MYIYQALCKGFCVEEIAELVKLLTLNFILLPLTFNSLFFVVLSIYKSTKIGTNHLSAWLSGASRILSFTRSSSLSSNFRPTRQSFVETRIIEERQLSISECKLGDHSGLCHPKLETTVDAGTSKLFAQYYCRTYRRFILEP